MQKKTQTLESYKYVWTKEQINRLMEYNERLDFKHYYNSRKQKYIVHTLMYVCVVCVKN